MTDKVGKDWYVDFTDALADTVERDGSAAVLAKWPGLKRQVAEAEKTAAQRAEQRKSAAVDPSPVQSGGTDVAV